MSKAPDKNIIKLWEMAIERLPQDVRSIGEYCELVGYDPENQIAQIHTSSEGLIEILKIRKPVLEQAFASVLFNPVEIRFLSNNSVNNLKHQDILSTEIQNTEFISQSFQVESKQLNNQGINAPHAWNNLYFRSKSELEIAKILDERGILFFPNIRGRASLNNVRINREIDFLICFEGRWGILECDGEQYH